MNLNTTKESRFNSSAGQNNRSFQGKDDRRPFRHESFQKFSNYGGEVRQSEDQKSGYFKSYQQNEQFHKSPYSRNTPNLEVKNVPERNFKTYSFKDKKVVNIFCPKSEIKMLINEVCGNNDDNLSFISQQINGKVTLRGVGSGYEEEDTHAESTEPLHLIIETHSQADLSDGLNFISNLLETVRNNFSQYLYEINLKSSCSQNETDVGIKKGIEDFSMNSESVQPVVKDFSNTDNPSKNQNLQDDTPIDINNESEETSSNKHEISLQEPECSQQSTPENVKKSKMYNIYDRLYRQIRSRNTAHVSLQMVRQWSRLSDSYKDKIKKNHKRGAFGECVISRLNTLSSKSKLSESILHKENKSGNSGYVLIFIYQNGNRNLTPEHCTNVEEFIFKEVYDYLKTITKPSEERMQFHEFGFNEKKQFFVRCNNTFTYKWVLSRTLPEMDGEKIVSIRDVNIYRPKKILITFTVDLDMLPKFGKKKSFKILKSLLNNIRRENNDLVTSNWKIKSNELTFCDSRKLTYAVDLSSFNYIKAHNYTLLLNNKQINVECQNPN